MSDLESRLLFQISAADLPKPAREVLFHPSRRWRFDFGWPDCKLAVEVEGGIWSGGRHTRGRGYEEDCRKYNQAVLLGWRVLRVTPTMIASGEALEMIEKALNSITQPW